MQEQFNAPGRVEYCGNLRRAVERFLTGVLKRRRDDVVRVAV